MYDVLDKDMIEMEIVPLIPRTKRDFVPTVRWPRSSMQSCTSSKTGKQWNQLPVKAQFSGVVALSW
jgi:hypothetical protein